MDLFGRRKLFTVENDITSENVANILNSVLPAHVQNMAQEEYLFPVSTRCAADFKQN